MLSKSYVALMQQHNGGIPYNQCHPMSEAASWAEDHISIYSIMGIGNGSDNTLRSACGCKYVMSEWGYPDIGVVICDTPTAGHTTVMLDYRKCRQTGEPEVVFVDQGGTIKSRMSQKILRLSSV